jgi:hypothetical protein
MTVLLTSCEIGELIYPLECWVPACYREVNSRQTIPPYLLGRWKRRKWIRNAFLILSVALVWLFIHMYL